MSAALPAHTRRGVKICCDVALRPEAWYAGERRCMSMHRCAGGASASAAPGPQPVAAAPAWRAIPCAGCRPRACSLASPGASPPQQPHSCPTWCIALSVAAARRPAARCRRLRCRAGPRGLSGPAQVLVGAAGLVSADVRAHLIFCLAGGRPHARRYLEHLQTTAARTSMLQALGYECRICAPMRLCQDSGQSLQQGAGSDAQASGAD